MSHFKVIGAKPTDLKVQQRCNQATIPVTSAIVPAAAAASV